MSRRRLLSCVDPLKSRYDVASANTMGDVVYVAGMDDVHPFDMAEIIRCIDVFVEGIGFDPAEDGFIVTGNNIVVAVAFGYMLSRFGSVKVLLYDASKQQYTVRRCSLPKDMLDDEDIKAVTGA